MYHYFSRNKEQFNAFPHIGGTTVVEKNLDIKKLLNSIEEGSNINNIPKKDNILNTISQYTTFNSNEYPRNTTMHNYLTTFNNIPKTNKNMKKNSGSFSTDLTKGKHLNTTTSSTYMDYYKYKNNTNTNYNFISTNNTSKILHTKRNLFRKNKTNHSNDYSTSLYSIAVP